MRAVGILLLLAACGTKNPKATPEWKAALKQLAPDCKGDELGDNGSWACQGDHLRLMTIIQDGRFENITVWIGTHDGADAALKKVEMFSVLVRPTVWDGVRTLMHGRTKLTSDSMREDGSPPERYKAGLVDDGPIFEDGTLTPMPTYLMSISWDAGY